MLSSQLGGVQPGPGVRAFVAYLLEHVGELAAENLRQLRTLDAPLLVHFADQPEARLIEQTSASLQAFLQAYAVGRGLEAAAESLRQWEAGRLPGLPEDAVGPEDLVLVNAAQRAAIWQFLWRFSSEPAVLREVIEDFELYYARSQSDALAAFTRIRERAARRAAHLEAERAEAQASMEEFQALNEELASQAEELQRQRDELGGVYERLRQHSQAVESEVDRRTEELRSANAELFEQATAMSRQRDELNAAYRELAAQSRLLDTVLNNLPAAVGYSDAELVIRAANNAYASALGTTPDALVGRGVDEVYPQDAPAIRALVDEVLATGKPWRQFGLPARFGPNGEPVAYQDASLVPVLDEDGRLSGFLSLAVDASERVRLEQEVERSTRAIERQKALMERVIDQAPAGIAYLDRDLVTRWLNPEMVRLFGRPAEAFLGRSILASANAEARDHFEALLRRVVDTGEPYEAHAVPYVFRRGRGDEQTYWDIVYVPVFDEACQVEGVLVFAQEVSARVEHERLQQAHIGELKRADRYKDDFLSVMSHELRTPLNFIMGFASVLDDELAGTLNAQQHEHIRRILSGADRMLLIVNDLLDYAKIQSGKLELNLEPTAYGALVRDAIAALQPLAEQKRLAVECEVDNDLLPVIDPHRTMQMLTNLLGNAVKFTPPDGRIRVTVFARDGEVVTEVADTGPGIPARDLERLFRPFEQLDMSATRVAGGTGLGLSITKALAEAQGGHVGVRSQLGRGSVFCFSLPLDRTPKTPGA